MGIFIKKYYRNDTVERMKSDRERTTI